MFISVLYMFWTAMCPSLGELLYQCDTWFMSLCVDETVWYTWFMSLCVDAIWYAYQTVMYTD